MEVNVAQCDAFEVSFSGTQLTSETDIELLQIALLGSYLLKASIGQAILSPYAFRRGPIPALLGFENAK